MTVGERIRERRLELKMSQDEMARRMGLTSANSRSTISKLEKQGNNMTMDRVVLAAKALDCDPGYLMGWEDEKKAADIAADMVDDPQLTEYVGKILALDEKSRAQIYSLIDLLLGK